MALATSLMLAGALIVGALTFRAVALGWHGPFGQDLDTYLGFTRQWLASGAWYDPRQLAGTYVVEQITANVYPPTLLYLTVPFALGVPVILWWVIPISAIGFAYWRRRPAWWAWPILAAALCYPRTWTVLVAGNPAMWAIAAGVCGVAWGWASVGASIKLTFLPLVLLGAPRRSWNRALRGLAILALPFGALWVDYLRALVAAQSSRGIGYVLGEWPIALALVAVAASAPSLQRPIAGPAR